jgi:hypothetical protein
MNAGDRRPADDREQRSVFERFEAETSMAASGVSIRLMAALAIVTVCHDAGTMVSANNKRKFAGNISRAYRQESPCQ